MEAELKEMREERERVARERGELSREFKRLQQKKKKFDIVKFRDSAEDVEFYTGLTHWDALILLYDLVSQKAQNLNYGSQEKLGRPRALTLFEEFVLTLMSLRLGLFLKLLFLVCLTLGFAL